MLAIAAFCHSVWLCRVWLLNPPQDVRPDATTDPAKQNKGFMFSRRLKTPLCVLARAPSLFLRLVLTRFSSLLKPPQDAQPDATADPAKHKKGFMSRLKKVSLRNLGVASRPSSVAETNSSQASHVQEAAAVALEMLQAKFDVSRRFYEHHKCVFCIWH